MSEDIAQGIGARGLQLHRPLPQSAHRLVDAARFIAKDLAGDLRTALLVGLGIGALASALPIATAMIFDTLIPGADRALLVQVGVLLALVAVVTFVLSMARGLALARINGRTRSSLQVALWDRVLRLPTRFFRDYSAGDLSERITDAESVRAAVLEALLESVIVLVFSVFNLILLFVYSPRLALVAVALIVVYVGVTALVGVLQIRHQRTVAQVRGVLSGRVFELLQGIMKLRVAAAEARGFARWMDAYAEQQLAVVRAGVLRNYHYTFQAAYPILAVATLFAAAGWLNTAPISPGVLIAFLAAYGIFQSALLAAAGAALGVLAALPMWERLKPILSAHAESHGVRADPGVLSGRIEVSGLSFSYDSRSAPVLEDISLVVEPGESVAIVGDSGSGKSTLLRLLLGFESPTTGTILYDGQELHGLDPALLRRQVGAVLQAGRMFSGSILDNIRGAHDLSFEACQEAAIAAGLEPELLDWPMGLYTPVTEGGTTLSGGQRQRILIARALAARPRLLFLDEATSALDNRTQRIVTETFDRLGVSRVIIAHRLSTVHAADRIYMLEGGRFVESGSFEVLMANGGRFAEFARRQIL